MYVSYFIHVAIFLYISSTVRVSICVHIHARHNHTLPHVMQNDTSTSSTRTPPTHTHFLTLHPLDPHEQTTLQVYHPFPRSERWVNTPALSDYPENILTCFPGLCLRRATELLNPQPVPSLHNTCTHTHTAPSGLSLLTANLVYRSQEVAR